MTSPPPDAPLPARYVVIGAAGQLGFDLVRTFDRAGELVALTRRELDVLDAGSVRAVLTDLRPTCVLNTTAYNRVDAAEDDRAGAFALNAEAVGVLAATCQALGATFVHFSTDYVFDGRRPAPYRESDAPNPLNVYGESKLEGERQALARCERAVIFRVSGLFGVARSSGKGGTNFVETMLRLARERKPVRVVADQVLGPSYTRDLAPKVWKVLPRAAHRVYHLTNVGETSWHGFARRVFALAGVEAELVPVTSAEFGARARRPAYSVLAHASLAALGEDDLRPWDAALAAYVAERASSV
ncbi:MAG: dTDP-4-dehydrorhamnose reductase [Candidatus Rokuibacteriota bacterium]|nr:MAG: dTDP-4-dehydrorhamnose reductase [Candidatus Rokubacteria bacterium]